MNESHLENLIAIRVYTVRGDSYLTGEGEIFVIRRKSDLFSLFATELALKG